MKSKDEGVVIRDPKQGRWSGGETNPRPATPKPNTPPQPTNRSAPPERGTGKEK